jgi:hypothetical protein
MAKPAAEASQDRNFDLIKGLRVFCSCVGTVRPASISEIFWKSHGRYQQRVGLNCREELHENDVTQSCFYLFL